MVKRKKKKKRASAQFQPFPANWFVVGALLVACVLTITALIRPSTSSDIAINAASPAVSEELRDPFGEVCRLVCLCGLWLLVWTPAILSVIFRLAGTTVEQRKVPKRGQKTG